jgi:hypothetical protein
MSQHINHQLKGLTVQIEERLEIASEMSESASYQGEGVQYAMENNDIRGIIYIYNIIMHISKIVIYSNK